jgi:pimeloyl-ACP methyl ester carboxylesterase
VSLLGWSLGGIYARDMAKLAPDDVRCVITLGTPFTGTPRATNAWRVYELASGERVESMDSSRFASPPPVPTTSIFSRTDGVVAWQCSLEQETSKAENIEVEASHIGLGAHPAVVYAIADRLAQPEGAWKKFDRVSALRSFFYKDPYRQERTSDWARTAVLQAA